MHQNQKGQDKELTNHCIRLIIDLLHIDMVHMPLVERIGLADSRIPIIVLVLRAHVGVVSHLPTLVTLNLAKVLLCIHHLTVMVVVPSIAISFSIAIAMLVPIVVVVAIMIVAITPHCDCVHFHHDDYVHGYVLHSHYRKYIAASVV